MSDYYSASELSIENITGLDLRRINEAANDNEPFHIHVGGVSAAGKTTLSVLLENTLQGAGRFSIDSFLREGLGKMKGQIDDTPTDPSVPFIGGINPAVWDMDLLERSLDELRRTGKTNIPKFDETIKDRVGFEPFVASRFVIFEGGHSLSDQFIDYADHSILVTAPFHDRLMRKLVRTYCYYKREDLDDIINRYVHKDEPSWEYYEPIFTERSDQVFYNPANPEDDYKYLPNFQGAPVNGKQRELIPIAGLTHAEEYPSLIEAKSGKFHIEYSVGEKVLLNLEISRESVSDLERHYYVV